MKGLYRENLRDRWRCQDCKQEFPNIADARGHECEGDRNRRECRVILQCGGSLNLSTSECLVPKHGGAVIGCPSCFVPLTCFVPPTASVPTKNRELLARVRSRERLSQELFWDLATSAQAYMGLQEGNPAREVARRELAEALDRVPWRDRALPWEYGDG